MVYRDRFTGANDVVMKDSTRLGQDRTAPEYDRPEPYDPFKADIFQLGNALLNVIRAYNSDGLEPFRKLAEAMTSPNPENRPSPTIAYLAFIDVGESEI
ncbi:hypothetical protein DXG01_001756 [Tephrocybe rancida]|nr:hypothetical protein DXG01_001756 [Tephrocybe rancida]